MTEHAERLVVVTPWYPTAESAYDGIFVRESVRALDVPADRCTIIHTHNVAPDEPFTVQEQRTPEGLVVRIDVPVDTMRPRVEVAEVQREALRRAARPELADAGVVVAHVGMPAGWAVAGLLAPHQRLVTIEHATYLPRILRLPEGEKAYGELLARADAHLSVTEREARVLRTRFPAARERIGAIGNPVDDERFELRERTATALDRWIYVGNLIERKGVLTLVKAFALWAGRPGHEDATLTLVGGGPQQEELAELASSLGVADRVRFHGPATQAELPGLFADADVLVHLSSYETFGLTVVEAAMTGLPVLVTACGGPQETLSDAQAQGLATIVRNLPEPEDVVEGIADLAERAATCDRRAVRDVLVERYGSTAYRRRLHAVLTGQPLDPVPAPEAPGVVCLALSSRGAGRLVRVQGEALRAGARVALFTTVRGDAVAADPRVAVLDLAPHEERMPWRSAVRLALEVAPAVLIRAVRKVLSLLAVVPGPQRPVVRRGVNLMSAVLSKQVRVAQALQRRIENAVWRHIDPPRVALLAIRRHLEWFRAQSPTIAVMGDDASLPLAWRLTRQFPDLEVVGAVNDAALRRLIAKHAQADGRELGTPR